MKNILKIIELNIKNSVLFFLFSSCICTNLSAQNNSLIEGLKFDNFHNSDNSMMKNWKKSLIVENKILEIVEYAIFPPSPFRLSHGGLLEDSKRDTAYSSTYVFDKETAQLIKTKTEHDSTLYIYNGDRKTTAIIFHPISSYSNEINEVTTTYNYLASFPYLVSSYKDSSYIRYIFNNDSLLIREERYDTARVLKIYIEYKYYNNYITKEHYFASSKNQFPSSKTYYYFTPDGGILETCLRWYEGHRSKSDVSLESYNVADLITERVIYGDFNQFRTSYLYNEKGLLVLIKYFLDDVLTSERFYKYITH